VLVKHAYGGKYLKNWQQQKLNRVFRINENQWAGYDGSKRKQKQKMPGFLTKWDIASKRNGHEV
jgi:hypothetical protein